LGLYDTPLSDTELGLWAKTGRIPTSENDTVPDPCQAPIHIITKRIHSIYTIYFIYLLSVAPGLIFARGNEYGVGINYLG